MESESSESEFDYIEQEMAFLRGRLNQFFQVLEDTSNIQHQFADLVETYQTLKQYSEEAKVVLDEIAKVQEEDFGNNFVVLEKKLEMKYGQLRQQVLELSGSVSQSDHQLRESMKQQETLYRDSFRLHNDYLERLSQLQRRNESTIHEIQRRLLGMTHIVGVLSIVVVVLGMAIAWLLLR